MRTQKSREGYLFVDHRASPGLPEDVAREAGYDPASCAEGKALEMPTMTCRHCGVVVVMNPDRTRERGYCFSCNHYVCDLCAVRMREPGYVHMPFEKLADIGADHMAKTGQPLGAKPQLILPPSLGSNP